jgi:hypothetical protein
VGTRIRLKVRGVVLRNVKSGANAGNGGGSALFIAIRAFALDRVVAGKVQDEAERLRVDAPDSTATLVAGAPVRSRRRHRRDLSPGVSWRQGSVHGAWQAEQIPRHRGAQQQAEE